MAPRIPKRNTRFIDSQAESSRGRSALEAVRGYAGAPSRASVMYPGTQRGYEAGELAGMAETLIPGAAMAKGALGAALAGVIKPRGGNWLAGRVENSLKSLLEKVGETDATRLAELRSLTGNPELGRSGEALGRWIEGPLTKYIKRDMATEGDPVRKLAEQGVLHYAPEAMPRYMDDVWASREKVGFPAAQGTAPLAQRWEAYADQMVRPKRLNEPIRESGKLTMRDMVSSEPGGEWALKAPDDTMTYELRRPGTSSNQVVNEELGLNHLVDELSNALNPESGLPRNLILRPEQLQQMGMEKAVRHVADINAWRAAQKAATDLELANKASVLREYPENNPKGLRWVELSPDEELAMMYKEGIPSGSENAKRYEEKLASLQKQLKYEGDTMGHCVGGYCPDVLEGKSRIFSLRDTKGEPHVTIEVAPPGRGPSSWIPEDEEHPVMWPDIIQIKGKGNSAPKDEYLPFVQDFVRNSPLGGTWGDVGDLGNARLHRFQDESGIKYLTPEEYNLPRKKEGGLVAQPDYFDDLDAFLGR